MGQVILGIMMMQRYIQLSNMVLVGIVSDYEGKMGGFGDNLSDKDIDSVLAYIKSFWPDDYYKHQINLSK